ncbi:MAG: type II toxin-antitoxin system PemK/MazF family toxin [Bacteroidota bacterium]|nr:type II toxin-antitoxin system PemK/MazF family toxin [Bacteroidota bacterium]
MKKGDIVLIPFPFTDLKGSKIRPALILHVAEFDVTVCFITSELKWQTEFDIHLSPTPTNGLKTHSIIRINKIATIDSDLVLGELGKLTLMEINELNESLSKLLQIR